MIKIQDFPKPLGLAALMTATLFAAGCPKESLVRAPGAKLPVPRELSPQEATPEILAFIAAAKAADKISDPLARCLSFPDIPGNHWPAGLTKAHCGYLFGPRITPKQIGEYLDRGAVKELDALFKRDLDRHFSKDNFSEVIHADFESIGASESSDLLTSRWLAKAPKSPYSQMARARFLRKLAGTVRGSDYAGNTPSEDMRRMSEYAKQSIELYQGSVKAEPRMMPAYAGLLYSAMLDSQPEVERAAFDAGVKVDPACMGLTNSMMIALQPKWGGDAPTMIAFAKRLSSDVSRRPLLSFGIAQSFIDTGDRLYDAGDYQNSMKVMLEASSRVTVPEVFENLARAMTQVDGEKLQWEIVMYQLEAGRFRARPYGRLEPTLQSPRNP